jgi:hypothetical protein
VTQTPALSQPSAPAAPAAGTLGERIVLTFLAPARLAERLRHELAWFDVLVVVVLVAMLAVFAVPDELYLSQAAEAVDRRGRAVEITSDPATIARWGRYLAMLTALVQWPLLVLGMAAALLVVFNGGLRAGLEFRQYMALSTHGFLVIALQQLTLLTLALTAGLRPESVSLAALLPLAREGGALYAVLDLVSPFTLWMLCVLGIGVGGLQQRIRPRTAVAVLVSGYLALAAALGLVLR